MAHPREVRALRDRVGRDEYQRACRWAAWEVGDLSYALHAGQIAARAMILAVHAAAVASGGVKRALLNIARRWGKTFLFVDFALEVMLKKPGARVPYAAMSATSVSEFVVPIIRELAAQAPPHLAPREYRGEWVIPATNSPLHRGQDYAPPTHIHPGDPRWRAADSRLIVVGCEDRKKADRLRGPATDLFVIDEAGFIPMAILDYVVRDVAAAQLSTTDGMMLVGSSAPESPEHEFWKLADEAQLHGAYMHATVYDAPHLTPRQIRSFAAEVGGEDSIAWQREGLSRRVVDVRKAVFPEWAEAELLAITKPEQAVRVIGEIERPAHYDVYVVGDVGFSDLTVVLLAYYDFDRALLVVVDEVVTRRQTSDVIEAKVRAKQHEHFGDLEPFVRALEGDAMVVASIRKEERIARGEAQRGEAESEETGDAEEPGRWSQIAFVQMDAAVNAVRLRIKRRGLLVHPRCKTLIAHLRGAIWNDARTDFVRVKGPEGHHWDGGAAVSYLVRKLQPNRCPYPSNLAELAQTPGVHVPAAVRAAALNPHQKMRRLVQPTRVRR